MRSRRFTTGMMLVFVCGSLLVSAAGCAFVKPFQREHLADRIMDPAARLTEVESDRKWLGTREGALGGVLGAGGGCACN